MWLAEVDRQASKHSMFAYYTRDALRQAETG